GAVSACSTDQAVQPRKTSSTRAMMRNVGRLRSLRRTGGAACGPGPGGTDVRTHLLPGRAQPRRPHAAEQPGCFLALPDAAARAPGGAANPEDVARQRKVDCGGNLSRAPTAYPARVSDSVIRRPARLVPWAGMQNLLI